MSCDFEANQDWRVAWDLSGGWDLSGCQALEVSIESKARARLSLTVYLQSGAGWYQSSMALPPGVQKLSLSRKSFGQEGSPAGWGRVKKVRMSFPRNTRVNAVVILKGIRAHIERSKVVIYQNTAGIKVEAGVPRYVREMADRLDRNGIAYNILDDREIEAGKLAGYEVAVLPLNPVISKRCGKAIRDFVAEGGKLIVCYSLPGPLSELLGIRSSGSMRGGQGELWSFAMKPGFGSKQRLIQQGSAWARKVTPRQGTEILAHWANRAGREGKQPAITRNENGLFFGHVLTQSDTVAKDRFLLATFEHFDVEVMQEAAAVMESRLGHVAGFKSLEELLAAIDRNLAVSANKKGVRTFLGVARKLSSSALAVRQKDQPLEAHARFGAAQRAYLKAYAASLPPKKGEIRAIWAHSPEGIKGWSWDKSMKALADNGFNTLIVNMLWGTAAAYNSKVLPVTEQARRDGDQLQACLKAAKKHGIAVHAWMVCWRVGWRTPKPYKDKLRADGRLQVDRHGKTLDWLSPAHPENRKLQRDALLEIVRKYDLAGIHLDYIRYPGLRGDFGDSMRQAFQKRFKLEVENWPQDLAGARLRQKFLQFRRDNVTALVKSVHAEARKINPKIQISAAVFWHWPTARDEVAQDWPLWARKGYLDFVCPMTYTVSAPEFDEQVRLTQKWSGGRIPLLPGIGMTLGQSPDVTLQQALITRKRNTAGFVLFDLNEQIVREYLPLFGLGMSRTQ